MSTQGRLVAGRRRRRIKPRRLAAPAALVFRAVSRCSLRRPSLGPFMPIRLSNVRTSIDDPEPLLLAHAARALDVLPTDLARWRILRKSLDMRDKSQLSYVYTLEVALPTDEQAAVARAVRRRGAVTAELYAEPPFELPTPGGEPLVDRPVIVGSGPAGAVAAYFLAEQGYRPIVLERGRAVRERIADMVTS